MTKSVSNEWRPRNKWIVPPGLAEIVRRFRIRCLIDFRKEDYKQSKPLLIQGPTGVGKSLFVDYYASIYKKFYEKTPKIVYINCAALPSELIESLLFGYKKGAFTGARHDTPGYFETIGDGIIVLEEMGEMEKNLQAKLLLAIENRNFSKLGCIKPIELESKIIATTNVKKSEVRDDLWYRFEIFSIPPIHKRRGDILYYINQFDDSLFKILPPGTILSLISYNWPGNVREIERVCRAMDENFEYTAELIGELKETSGLSVTGDKKTRMYYYMSIDESVTSFAFDKADKLKEKLLSAKINHRKIEQCLKFSGLSFECFEGLLIANNQKFNTRTTEKNKHENFEILNILEFREATSGFQIFCKIFFQDEKANHDILELSKFINHKEYDRNLSFNEIPINPTIDLADMCFIEGFKHHDDNIFARCIHTSLITNICQSNIEDAHRWPDIFQEALKCSLKYLTGFENIEITQSSFIEDLYSFNKGNNFLKEYFGNDQGQAYVQEILITDINGKMLEELYLETICNHIGMKRGFQTEIASITGYSDVWVSQNDFLKNLKNDLKKFNKHPRKRIVILE
ncbi:sigma 54-interacting transcriptional regulator [Desulfomicrobium escambiense]|uniref:sigma 54-interacting transcriptional regulator n=1 Tax=Desulfomicrobium escambiense TaxID=29503 RepID=UPI00040F3619|nr:sigma 54-interacting transcriptional regulator [Desulfomicrobium escambiense]